MDDTAESYPTLTVAEVIALEKQIVAKGTSLFDLMQRAGASVSDYVLTTFETSHAVIVFCGSGNNGGDGWVVAGNLAQEGYPVSLISPCAADELKVKPARDAALEVISGDYPMLSIFVSPSQEQLRTLLSTSTVIVDALLGIGFYGEHVKEPYCSWIAGINKAKDQYSNLHIVAVDIPSGLSADTGRAAEPCIVADATITMLAYKPGLLFDASRQYCGTVHLAQIND